MTDKTYNGWTNYETWRVNLEIFDGMTAVDLTGRRVPCVSELKDALRDYALDVIETSSPEGLARDYALAFLDAVDWWSIANHIMADELRDELAADDTADEPDETYDAWGVNTKNTFNTNPGA